MRVLALWPCCFALWACGGDGGAIASASARLAPHRAAFADLDRWARRVATSSELVHDERALAETVFAKIRSTPEVLGAWIELDAKPRLTLSLPAGSTRPDIHDALLLRDPELGALLLMWRPTCADVVPPRPRVRLEGPCIVVTRDASTPKGHLRVTAAFAEVHAHEAE